MHLHVQRRLDAPVAARAVRLSLPRDVQWRGKVVCIRMLIGFGRENERRAAKERGRGTARNIGNDTGDHRPINANEDNEIL